MELSAFLLQVLNGLDKGSAYALIALGLTLIFGTLGVVNFAHGALFMLGAYRIWQRDEDDSEADNFAVERKFFRLSLWYLFAHFMAILFEALLRPYGLGGW